jgi:hypothetical protein
MTFCRLIITPVTVVLRAIVEVIREVVRTVCDWVRGFVTTVKTVVEQVCSWLPWPLSAVCDLVTRVIEVVEEVWTWVCREVLERIVELVERIVEYVIYILKWVCWVVAWPVRVVELVLCRLGFRPRLRMHICIRVLTDATGSPAVSWAKVRRDFREASRIFEQCNIELVLMSAERIERPEYVRDLTCDVAGMLTRAFTWFSASECIGCAAVTVYYVDDVALKIGCSWPGTDWVLVDRGGDGATVAHEIGHLAGLWAHSTDPQNLMYESAGGTALSAAQCCMIRSSHYVIGERRCPGVTEAQLPDVDAVEGMERTGDPTPTPSGSDPPRLACPGIRSLRQEGAEPAPVPFSGPVAAIAAAAIVLWAGGRLRQRLRR